MYDVVKEGGGNLNWEIIIPIIVAIITSGLSYLAARNKNKSEIEKMEIEMKTKIELAEKEHKNNLAELEKEMLLQSKTAESQAITDVSTKAFESILESTFFQDELQNIVKKSIKKKN